MLRAILFTHRWLGIVIGAIMTIWCLSGFVMMYSPYPRLQTAEQLQGLSPLQLPTQVNWDAVAIDDAAPLMSVRLERMGAASVLRIMPAMDPGPRIAQTRATPDNIDLATGQPVAALSQAEIFAVARDFARNSGSPSAVTAITPIAMDQWTVQTSRRHQPLHRVDYADGATVYVAGSGEIVQQTTRAERFWGWLGAVPHWLYPTVLRQNGPLWSQVVIWTSTIGCFLTVTGLWVGIARLRRDRQGKLGSPYRGLWWWHHMIGLFFGVLTLTWVFSGLLSMNPMGFLGSEAGFAEGDRLAGTMRWGDVKPALAAVQGHIPADVVRIETAPLAGTTYLTLVRANGERIRVTAAGIAAPLTGTELRAALRNGPALTSLELMTQSDNYYYEHKNPAKLPVWRAILKDDEQTRLYIDATSGRLIRAFDRDGRGFRWLMNGLHSLDFPGLRTRPIWDIVVIPLLAMVTVVCGTGTWMGIAKLRRDARRIRNRRRRRAAARAAARQQASPT